MQTETAATTDDRADVRPLSPRVLILWRLPFVAITVLVAVGTAVISAVGAPAWALVAALAALVLAVVGALRLPGVRYRSWSYRVGADQLDIRSGIVVRSESSVPYFRVQHIDIRRGPLERWRDVVSLDISTASPSTAATLPGIDPADAEQLRTYILARAGLEDGV